MKNTNNKVDNESRRNIIIYQKNKGFGKYRDDRHSYMRLAVEYGVTPSFIGQTVTRVTQKFSRLVGKEFFKDGVPMRYQKLLEGGDSQ
jgi:hypothetical protein